MLGLYIGIFQSFYLSEPEETSTTTTEEKEEDLVELGKGMGLGDMLEGLTADSMISSTRQGLIRFWTAPHLAQSQREGRFKAAADAAGSCCNDSNDRIERMFEKTMKK